MQILIDGRDAFADRLPGWQGFDPAEMLGESAPLVPQEPAGLRVAVYRCSCGIAGCGVIAPVIVASPDGRRVSWVDFRDYTGVFTGPAATDGDGDDDEGTPWPFQDVHFERGQYLGEIRRASADHSWETRGRATARLIAGRLRAAAVVLPPGLSLDWAAPAEHGEAVLISFQTRPVGDTPFAQQILRLASDHREPQLAARDILHQLGQVPVGEWVSRFGWQPAPG